jgi:hypothetical protein
MYSIKSMLLKCGANEISHLFFQLAACLMKDNRDNCSALQLLTLLGLLIICASTYPTWLSLAGAKRKVEEQSHAFLAVLSLILFLIRC